MTAGKGKCLCGAVQVSAKSLETDHGACHCRMCRRWSSGPLFATQATGVSFEGEENITVYSSSDWAERGFCKTCGANLFYHLKGTDLYFLGVGLFDEPDNFTLAHEVYIDTKPEGYEFAGDRPTMTEAEVIAKFAPPD